MEKHFQANVVVGKIHPGKVMLTSTVVCFDHDSV